MAARNDNIPGNENINNYIYEIIFQNNRTGIGVFCQIFDEISKRELSLVLITKNNEQIKENEIEIMLKGEKKSLKTNYYINKNEITIIEINQKQEILNDISFIKIYYSNSNNSKNKEFNDKQVYLLDLNIDKKKTENVGIIQDINYETYKIDFLCFRKGKTPGGLIIYLDNSKAQLIGVYASTEEQKYWKDGIFISEYLQEIYEKFFVTKINVDKIIKESKNKNSKMNKDMNNQNIKNYNNSKNQFNKNISNNINNINDHNNNNMNNQFNQNMNNNNISNQNNQNMFINNNMNYQNNQNINNMINQNNENLNKQNIINQQNNNNNMNGQNMINNNNMNFQNIQNIKNNNMINQNLNNMNYHSNKNIKNNFNNQNMNNNMNNQNINNNMNYQNISNNIGNQNINNNMNYQCNNNLNNQYNNNMNKYYNNKDINNMNNQSNNYSNNNLINNQYNNNNQNMIQCINEMNKLNLNNNMNINNQFQNNINVSLQNSNQINNNHALNYEDIYNYIKENKINISFKNSKNNSIIKSVSIPASLRNSELYYTADKINNPNFFEYSNINSIKLYLNNQLIPNNDEPINKIVFNGAQIFITETIEDLSYYDSLNQNSQNTYKTCVRFDDKSGNRKINTFFPSNITVKDMLHGFFSKNKIPVNNRNYFSFHINSEKLDPNDKTPLNEKRIMSGSEIDFTTYDINSDINNMNYSKKDFPGKKLNISLLNNKDELIGEIYAGSLQQIKTFYEKLKEYLSKKNIDLTGKSVKLISGSEVITNELNERTFSSFGILNDFKGKIDKDKNILIYAEDIINL